MATTHRFAGLNRAQLSYDYLHTNSTTHEFLFGAMVEMVDNSKDAGASTCAIWALTRPYLRGGRILCILDDGIGMSPEEAQAVMTFGYSAKRGDPNMIGQYGNGLKSGAMRIGKDLIVFTKKDDVITCIFLSRTFHDEEGIDEIIVPTPSFSLDGRPITEDLPKHQMELEIILRHSPFRSMDDLKEQFNLLKNRTGTLVMIYNLKLNEDARPELDFDTDPQDIRLSDPDGGGGDKAAASLVPERNSLRAYLSVIYSYPRMKLYVNGKKVRTRSVVAGLYKPRQYKFSSTKFKMRAEQQVKELRDTLKVVQERKKEADSKLKEFEKKNGAELLATNKEIRLEWRRLQDDVQLRKQEIDRLKENTNSKIKLLKDPKTLTFIFGLNVENRSHDGCFVYNNGRLIKMYEKAGCQTEGGVRGSGVVGVVDVPLSLMEPTHNKQDFADNREYRQLLKSMGDHLDQYWNDVNLAKENGGVLQFWQQFGYASGMGDWNCTPTNEDRYVKKRMMSVNITLQCDACLKWRVLPFDSRCLKEGWPPDNWTCANNPDTMNNKCSFQEKPIQIPTGKLQKETISVQEKREQLQKKIEKQQAEVEKLSGLRTVKSKRDMAEAAAEKRRMEEREREAAEKQKAAAAAEAASRKRKAQREKQEAPVLVSPRRVGQSPRTSSSSAAAAAAAAPMTSIQPARRAKQRPAARSPSPPPPPPKKPRTKAELRKQMQQKQEQEEQQQQQKKAPILQASSDEEEEEEEESADTASTSTATITTTPIAKRPPARKSIVASTTTISSSTTKKVAAVIEVVTSTTPSSDTKKSVVQREEAHSTAVDNNTSTSLSSSSSAASTPQPVNSAVDHQQQKQRDESIAVQKLRRLFHFFLPPNYKHSKSDIGAMSAEQLISIDLPEFFQAYEIGLKKLVQENQIAAEKAQNDLRQLRRTCVRFAEARGVHFEQSQQQQQDGASSSDEGENVEQAMREYLKKIGPM